MALTPEQARRRLAELRLKELQAKESAPAAPEPVAEEPTERRWFDRPRAVIEGLTWGIGDELGALAGAGMAKADQLITGRNKDQSFGDIYREMHGQFQDESDTYEKNHGGEALALNLVGGLTTGGVGIAKSAATSVLKRAAAAMAAGAAEGAVTGAASADQGFGNRLAGAGIGAGFGAATGGLIHGAGGLANTVAKRRVAQELGKGDNFIPLNVAAGDSVIGKLYKDLVGRSWGGAQKLLDQTLNVAEPMVRRFNTLKEKASALPRTLGQRVQKGKDEAADLFNLAMKEGSERLDDETGKLLEGITAKSASEQATVAARLREIAKTQAIPPGVPDELRQKIMTAPAAQANNLLKDWYNKQGFKVVKGRQFKWDGGLKKMMDDMVGNDPSLALELGPISASLKEMTDQMGKAAAKAGTNIGSQRGDDLFINGDALMAMRNVFARNASRGTATYSSGAINQIKKQFDKMIESQMDDATIDLFRLEKKAYGATVAFNDAVEKAVNKRQGEFTPDDWVASLPKDKAALKRGLLQLDAEAGQDAVNASKKAEKKATKAANKGLSKSKAALREAETAKRTQAERRVPIKQQVDLKQAEMDSQLQRARQQLEEMQKLAPPEAASGLSQVLSTEYLSPDMGLANSAIVKLLSGTQMGRALTTEGVQRTIAGQTAFQKALARDLRVSEKEREILGRAIRRGATQQAAQE